MTAIGGAKTIGFWSSIALLINNITGPGIPSLPNMFAEAGWLVPVLCLLAVWLMTTLSAAMFCEAMERIPGNTAFAGRIEYSTIVNHYFGRRWYFAAQVGLNGALQSLCVISVVQSAQVMDVFISAVAGKTCGLNLTPFANILVGSTAIAGSDSFASCVDAADLSNGNAWGCHVVLSVGFALTAAMAIPCGRWNLDDNMIIQRVAFVLTCLCWLTWLVAALSAIGGGDDAGGNRTALTPLPAVNNDPNTGSVAGVLGTILFNFGFVTTVPSWVNEKHPATRVNPTLWSATTLCVLIFGLMGIPAALAFAPMLQGGVTGTCQLQQHDPNYNCANDLMQVFTQPSTAPWQTSKVATFILQASVYSFPIVAVVSSIPIFSIVVKYNLVENGASPRLGFLWGVVFPWALAFPLVHMPDVLQQFINFTSLIFVAFTDFIVPFSLYVVLQRRSTQQQLSLQSVAPLSACTPPLLPPVRATSATGDGSEVEGYVGANAAAVHLAQHHALPAAFCTYDAAPQHKSALSVLLGSALTLMAVVAIYLTVVQGSYDFGAKTCALVGN